MATMERNRKLVMRHLWLAGERMRRMASLTQDVPVQVRLDCNFKALAEDVEEFFRCQLGLGVKTWNKNRGRR
jgi:hypothetical protein